MAFFEKPDDPSADALGEELFTTEGVEHAPFEQEIGDEEPIIQGPTITSPNIEAAQRTRGALDTGPSNLDVAQAEFRENSVPVALIDALHEREVGPVDPDFKWGAKDFGAFVQKWGVDQANREQFLDYVTEARSAEHANVLAREYLASLERQKTLGEASLGQRAATLGAAIVLDPVAILGGSTLTAVRGVRATSVAVGAMAASEQALLSAASPTQDETDVAVAGAVGVIGGALIGALTRGAPGVHDTASDAIQRMTREGADYANEVAPEATRATTAPVESKVAALGRADREAEELAEEFAGGRAATLADEPTEVPSRAPDAEPEDLTPNLTAIADEVKAEGGIVKKAPTTIPFLRSIPGLRTIQDRGLNSKSPRIRAITQRTILEDVGDFQASGKVTQVDAQMNEAVILSDAMMEFEPAAKAWARNTGRRWNEDAVAEFSEEVGKALRRGGSASPDINRMVLKAQEGYRRALAMGKRAGTFDEGVADSDTYLSRIWSGEKVRFVIAEHGLEAVEDLMFTSMKSGLAKVGRTIDDKLLMRIAKGFVSNIRDRADGVNVDTMVGLQLDNLKKLDEVLQEMDIARADIDAIKLQLKNQAPTEGKISQAKARFQLEETAGIVTKKGGLTIEDMLENDIRKILPAYARRVGSDVAFREGLGVPATEAGIKRLRDQVRREGLKYGEESFADDFEHVLREQAGLMRANTNPDGIWPRIGAGARNFSFMTFGWLFGTASLAEFGAVVGKLGVLKTFQAIPEMRRVFRDAKSGRLDHDFLDHVLGYTGLGLDSAIRPTARKGIRFDGVRNDFVNANTKFEKFLEGGRNFTARYSGLQGLTEWQRRQVPLLVLSEIERVMMRGGEMSWRMAHRMAQMGYDEKSLKTLFNDLNRFGVEVGSQGRWIRRANMEEWAVKAPESHARFMQALMREADRTIIDVSAGKTPAWMTTQWGKVLGQFLSFTVHSYNTHLLRGLAIRDHQVMMNMLTSVLIASTVGTGITYARFHNDPVELNKRLTIENMAKWGVARSTFGGIPSMGVDSLLGLLGRDGFFNARHSNLDSQVFSLDSTPSVSLLNRVAEAGKRVLQVGTGQKPATGDDIRSALRLTPLTVIPSAVKGLTVMGADALDIPRKDPRK